MPDKFLRAIPGVVSALALFLLLPALGVAQPPEPALPETDPGPAAVAPAPAPVAPGYADRNPAAEVKALELRRFDAMVKGDTVILGSMLAEDLTYTHTTGAVDSKAGFLESLASGKLRYLAVKPDGVEVRLFGEATAVVTGRIDARVVANGKEASFLARYTSVYTKRHGRWLLAAWQATRLGS
jgi:uncharacterized protein (TIGR02246 family)